MKLYKYRSMASRGNERVFSQNEIHFCSARDFNDPFDCRPLLRTPDPERAKHYAKYLVEKNLGASPRSARRRKVSEVRKRVSHSRDYERLYLQVAWSFGLYCLSEVCDSILMWSHYADNHQGFCLEFAGEDPEELPFPLCWPVTYQKELPVLDTTVTMDDIYTDEIVRVGLMTKYSDWAYEKEWRALETSGPGLRPFSPGTLTGVILGARMSTEDREKVLAWVGHHSMPLKVSEARLSRDRFALEIVQHRGSKLSS